MSLNITPPYLPSMKKEKSKELNIPFTQYMDTYIENWTSSKKICIPPKQQEEYDKWFCNY